MIESPSETEEDNYYDFNGDFTYNPIVKNIEKEEFPIKSYNNNGYSIFDDIDNDYDKLEKGLFNDEKTFTNNPFYEYIHESSKTDECVYIPPINEVFTNDNYFKLSPIKTNKKRLEIRDPVLDFLPIPKRVKELKIEKKPIELMPIIKINKINKINKIKEKPSIDAIQQSEKELRDPVLDFLPIPKREIRDPVLDFLPCPDMEIRDPVLDFLPAKKTNNPLLKYLDIKDKFAIKNMDKEETIDICKNNNDFKKQT